MDTSQPPALIVFSDLDGTLLDHETYDHAPARPALGKLRAAGLPLVLASSKTAPEIAAIRDALGFADCPAIVENGAGLLPAGPFHPENSPAPAYAALRGALDRLPARLRADFSGFGDWGAAEIARRTGLAEDAARLAGQRQFSEPGIWSGSERDLRAFLAELGQIGVSALRGGRYLTLSFGSSKSDRMAEVIALYRAPGGPEPRTLALGDAPNDIEMLERADRGVIVANPTGARIPRLAGEETGAITRTRRAGPAGWNEGVLEMLTGIATAQLP
jgi:mannosyl-3-phosphoglycerate phosphatase